MSPARRLLRLVSFAALAAALLFFWQSRRPAPVAAATATTGSAPQPTPPRRTPQRPQQVGATVFVDIIDSDGDPIEDVQISLNGTEGRSDARGQITLHSVQQGVGITEVEAPWLIAHRSSSGPVRLPSQHRLLILERACPGALRIVEEDGGPIEGARVIEWSSESTRPEESAVPLLSDDRGDAYLPQRPCGDLRAAVRLPGGETVRDLAAFAEGSAPAELVVPARREGSLQVLSPDGFPLDATLRALAPAEIAEEGGPGRFALSARRALLPVAVQAGSLPEQRLQIPLTGGLHEVVLSAPRSVTVSVLCEGDDCPEALTCAMARCAVERDAFTCPCPDEQAAIAMVDGDGVSFTLGSVYPDEDRIELDIRPSISLRGRWIGNLPCRVSVAYERNPSFSATGSCDAEGRFSLLGLRPGTVTVSVQGRGEQVSHTLELGSGVDFDMGELWPEGQDVSGQVEADFSLRGARLSSWPSGTVSQVSLDSDGWFVLPGLPAQAEEVTLTLTSSVYGTFRETFALERDAEIQWRVSWLPEESDLGDTGGDSGMLPDVYGDSGMDSGMLESDTGWSEIGDSGL